jgi:hypothetical protein
MPLLTSDNKASPVVFPAAFLDWHTAAARAASTRPGGRQLNDSCRAGAENPAATEAA